MLVRAVSGVNVSAGSVWMGRHCMPSVVSLDSDAKTFDGSVVIALDWLVHVAPPFHPKYLKTWHRPV